jgi:mono/diheme cytochrome c family protein
VDSGHKTVHKDAGTSGNSASGSGNTGASSSGTSSASAGANGTKKGDASVATPPDKTAMGSTWCDIEPLVQAHCQSCHGTKQLYGAPMPLMAASDFQAKSNTDASTTVLAQAMLRLHDPKRPMPPSSSPSPQLSADDLAKLDAWLAQGAPAGSTQSCAAQAGDAGAPAGGANGRALADDDAPWPEDCGEHYTMVASATSGGKVSIAPGQEFYQNVMIAAPWGDKQVQALRFKPVLDNLKVLHHYILYGPDQSFVEGWAPGQAGIIMPPTVGLQLKNGQYRLELHYNNTTGTKTELDGSGLELCVAKTARPNVAAVHEVGSLGISLPPGQKTEVVSECKPTVSKGPVHLIEGHPHMHTKGVHAKTIITRANGKVETMHDAPFSFQEQRKYPLPEDGSAADILINAGDKITYTCTWQNDTNRQITFGQNTTDEMCFYYIIAWPLGQLVDGSRGPEGDPNACGLGGGLF